MKKTQIIKISDIVWDEDVYPRNNYNWMVALTYKNSMKTGNKFPPIIVGLLGGKIIGVDGRHRSEANKLMKVEYIKAEVLRGLNKNELYVEAVKRNTQHGQPLSVWDRTNIIIKLEQLGYNPINISNIVGMPVKEVNSFKVKKVTNTITGKELALKPEFRHLRDKTVDDNFDEVQKPYGGLTQQLLVKELNSLFANKLINIKDKKVLIELRMLYQILSKVKSITK